MDDHLIGFSSGSCLSVQGKQQCTDILSVFGSEVICEHILCLTEKINIVLDVGGNSVALASLRAGNNFEKLQKRGDEQGLKKMHNFSAQYLFNADVADKSLCLSSMSV